MAVLPLPSARDVMTRSLATLRPGTPLFEAVRTLLDHDISGAPVVDDTGSLLGLVSEHDCLRVIAGGEFHDYGQYANITVADMMAEATHTISPELDLYGIAGKLVKHRVRRLPVLENDSLIGIVSRRDVLRALDRQRAARKRPRKKYPDYPEGREPSGK